MTQKLSLRRAITFYLVVTLLSVSLALGATLAKGAVTPVYACSWSVEHTNTASKAFTSGYFHATDHLYARITTYAGGIGVGCSGYKYYVSQQWTVMGTPGAYYTTVRVWICGTYYGTWAAGDISVTSPSWFHYGSCPRQADNYGSYFHDTYGNQNIAVYVTQG